MHARLLFTILLVFAVLLAWALVLWVFGRNIGRGYVAGLAIGQLLVMAEFVIGVLLLFGDRQPTRQAMHIVYGVVALLTVPLAAAYLRERTTRSVPLIYAFVCLFVCAIALRGLATGR